MVEPLPPQALAYLKACSMELDVQKPGNVSHFSAAHDMNATDFIKSAELSVGALISSDYSLGEKIFHAVKSTREVIHCNTNLGIILLAAPILHAYAQRQKGQTLHRAVIKVLQNTTVEDCRWAYKAISLANPGGLGNSKEQDVDHSPDVNLTSAMEIAASKDKIAYQYAHGFKDIFEYTILEYNSAIKKYGDYRKAIISVFSQYLCRFPDSHIERKYGNLHNNWILIQMKQLLHGLDHSDDSVLFDLLAQMDQAFKHKNINPGTTADITVTTLLVVFLEQQIMQLDCTSF